MLGLVLIVAGLGILLGLSSKASAAPSNNVLPPAQTSGQGFYTNLNGMECGYKWNPDTGPVPGTDYPVFDNRLINYYKSKGFDGLRILFCWEAMQSTTFGRIPGENGYKVYFDNYKRVVDYATSIGLSVIITPWQQDEEGNVSGATWRNLNVTIAPEMTQAFLDFWTKMASIFKDNPRVEYCICTEPNNVDTMKWWAVNQMVITAIRSTGSRQRIHVPGNGWTAAGSWLENWYDTNPDPEEKRSNAYGWLNARAPGLPIVDPGNNIVADIHMYWDTDAGGSTSQIVSKTIGRQRVSVAANEAKAHGYSVFVGETGLYAGNPISTEAWQDFNAFLNEAKDSVKGFAWWAAGNPGWWDDVNANGGGHFSITPTNGQTFTGDTINMKMIEPYLHKSPTVSGLAKGFSPLLRLRVLVPISYVKTIREKYKENGQKVLLQDIQNRIHRLGFSDTLLVTQDPTNNSIFTVLSRRVSNPPAWDPIIQIQSSEYVEEPPQFVNSNNVSIGAISDIRVLDPGLGQDEVMTIQKALLEDKNPRHLNGLASTLEPWFPVSASMLRAKAFLIESRLWMNPQQTLDFLKIIQVKRQPSIDAIAKSQIFDDFASKSTVPKAILRDEVKRAICRILDDSRNVEKMRLEGVPEPIVNLAKSIIFSVRSRDHTGGRKIRLVCPDTLRRTMPPDGTEGFVSPSALQLALASQKPAWARVETRDRLPEIFATLDRTKSSSVDLDKARSQMERANRAIERRRWIEWYRRSMPPSEAITKISGRTHG